MGVFRQRFMPYAKRRKRIILGSTGSIPTVLFNPTFRHGLLTDGQKRQIVTTDISGMPTAATQAQQETGSSTSVYVSPGRQQYHASAAKGWAYITVSGGTPSIAASYNVVSITDSGNGLVTVTWDVDFSSANYSVVATCSNADGSNNYFATIGNTSSPVAGSVVIESLRRSDWSNNDPPAYYVAAFGDQ